MSNKSERQIKVTFAKGYDLGGGTKNFGKSMQKSTNNGDGLMIFQATNVINNRDGFMISKIFREIVLHILVQKFHDDVNFVEVVNNGNFLK